jgi:hypothetical protein
MLIKDAVTATIRIIGKAGGSFTLSRLSGRRPLRVVVSPFVSDNGQDGNAPAISVFVFDPDAGSEAHRQAALAKGVRYRVNRRCRHLTAYPRFINRRRSASRARVEHVFYVVKRLWGFSKVRYRSLAKNTARLYTAFALANLYLLRRRLMPLQWTCAL